MDVGMGAYVCGVFIRVSGGLRGGSEDGSETSVKWKRLCGRIGM